MIANKQPMVSFGAEIWDSSSFVTWLLSWHCVNKGTFCNSFCLVYGTSKHRSMIVIVTCMITVSFLTSCCQWRQWRGRISISCSLLVHSSPHHRLSIRGKEINVVMYGQEFESICQPGLRKTCLLVQSFLLTLLRHIVPVSILCPVISHLRRAFLESPETFRVDFGQDKSHCVLKTKTHIL